MSLNFKKKRTSEGAEGQSPKNQENHIKSPVLYSCGESQKQKTETGYVASSACNVFEGEDGKVAYTKRDRCQEVCRGTPDDHRDFVKHVRDYKKIFCDEIDKLLFKNTDSERRLKFVMMRGGLEYEVIFQMTACVKKIFSQGIRTGDELDKGVKLRFDAQGEYSEFSFIVFVKEKTYSYICSDHTGYYPDYTNGKKEGVLSPHLLFSIAKIVSLIFTKDGMRIGLDLIDAHYFQISFGFRVLYLSSSAWTKLYRGYSFYENKGYHLPTTCHVNYNSWKNYNFENKEAVIPENSEVRDCEANYNEKINPILPSENIEKINEIRDKFLTGEIFKEVVNNLSEFDVESNSLVPISDKPDKLNLGSVIDNIVEKKWYLPQSQIDIIHELLKTEMENGKLSVGTEFDYPVNENTYHIFYFFDQFDIEFS